MDELEKRNIKIIELISLVFGIASFIFCAFSKEDSDKYTDTGLKILFISSFITSAVLGVCFFITLVKGLRGLSSVTLFAMGVYMILAMVLADNQSISLGDFTAPIVMIIACILYIVYVNCSEGLKIPIIIIMIICSIIGLLASLTSSFALNYTCYFIAVLISTVGSFMAYEKTYEL